MKEFKIDFVFNISTYFVDSFQFYIFDIFLYKIKLFIFLLLVFYFGLNEKKKKENKVFNNKNKQILIQIYKNVIYNSIVKLIIQNQY